MLNDNGRTIIIVSLSNIITLLSSENDHYIYELYIGSAGTASVVAVPWLIYMKFIAKFAYPVLLALVHWEVTRKFKPELVALDTTRR